MGRKGELAKEKIIDTAIKLYSLHGFDKTSFQMIAKELSITHTAPIYHFKNKMGLFAAVVERVFARADKIVGDSVLEGDTADIKILKYFQGHITWTYIFKREADIFALLSYFASIDNEFADIYLLIMKKKRGEIMQILDEGIKNKVFHYTIETEVQAQVVLDQLFGLLLYRLAGRKDIRPVEEVNIQIKETLNNLLSKGSHNE